MPSPASDTRIQVSINNTSVEGLLRASFVSSNCFSADCFSITFAIGASPLCGILFWTTLSSAYVTVSVSIDSGISWQNLISGLVDMVHLDPVKEMVSIEGRDLSSLLIDSYRQQDFVNQTASEVVSIIANNHGLNPVVSLTSGNVGRYYSNGYTRLSLGQFSRLRSDWDVVVQLARENDFDVFVQGKSLFFQPSVALTGSPVCIAFEEAKTIRFECALGISPNATVRVQSWNSQKMASYDSSQSGAIDTGGVDATEFRNQPFLFTTSNFTLQQVHDTVERYTAEVSRLSTVLHIEMPWNLLLAPRTVILIYQTGSSLDSLYKIDHIERHYSSAAGSSQIIRAAAI